MVRIRHEKNEDLYLTDPRDLALRMAFFPSIGEARSDSLRREKQAALPNA